MKALSMERPRHPVVGWPKIYIQEIFHGSVFFPMVVLEGRSYPSCQSRRQSKAPSFRPCLWRNQRVVCLQWVRETICSTVGATAWWHLPVQWSFFLYRFYHERTSLTSSDIAKHITPLLNILGRMVPESSTLVVDYRRRFVKTFARRGSR